ncbi:MAG: threonine transporter RhtB [Pseudoalteromonas sp.]|nr:threonine transporter RhtB [Pseudoalteromonas sp.]|tara:strand:- start:154 stop:786 length:633 start_codon:yes stop_codon:yes gene_type:complete
MLNHEALIAFSVVCFVLSITPGPSILYIIARSISQGPMAGIAAASGMALGSFVYVIATILGISAIFKLSPIAYTSLKVIGALYLVYLGSQYFKSSNSASKSPELNRLSNLKIMKQSFIVELTNPKTALFFIAFFPQFISETMGSVPIQLMILGIIYTLITLCCDTSIALLSGKITKQLNANTHSRSWPDKLAGTIMFILAATIGFETFNS